MHKRFWLYAAGALVTALMAIFTASYASNSPIFAGWCIASIGLCACYATGAWLYRRG
jgi:hypothetical protein